MKKIKSSYQWQNLLLLLVIMSFLIIVILFFAGKLNHQKLTAQQFVNLQEGDNPHLGFRRAHAKGICVYGDFESNGNLAEYSTARIFNVGVTPLLGRFSVAGNNPTAPDLKAPVRSLAFALNSDTNQEWRSAMNTPPVTAVATPGEFFEQLKALSPDPVTKQRDPEKIKAFFAAHPESKAFTEWNASYVPTNSFSTEHYHSINAFYLIDKLGKKQAVRWEAIPQVTQENAPMLDTKSADALQRQLIALLDKQAVKFDLVFTLADDDDDENNPTKPWPSERKQVNAGTLILTSWEAQATGQCAGKNFDPTVLPDGMIATADPILRARSVVYAESFHRRATETMLGIQEIPTTQSEINHEVK